MFGWQKQPEPQEKQESARDKKLPGNMTPSGVTLSANEATAGKGGPRLEWNTKMQINRQLGILKVSE